MWGVVLTVSVKGKVDCTFVVTVVSRVFDSYYLWRNNFLYLLKLIDIATCFMYMYINLFMRIFKGVSVMYKLWLEFTHLDPLQKYLTWILVNSQKTLDKLDVTATQCCITVKLKMYSHILSLHSWMTLFADFRICENNFKKVKFSIHARNIHVGSSSLFSDCGIIYCVVTGSY